MTIIAQYGLTIYEFRWPTSLVRHYDVKGALGLGEREHRPLQWPHVSLLTQGTLQIQISLVRQRSDPTLEQTNKYEFQFFLFSLK